MAERKQDLGNYGYAADMNKLDEDGSLDLYFQNESPGKDKEANWLPAPNGPFWMAMRLYWPKDEATSGKWAAPPVKRVQ